MFCLTYTPPGKTNLHFIPPCAAELYEVFDRLKAASRLYPRPPLGIYFPLQVCRSVSQYAAPYASIFARRRCVRKAAA